MTARPPCPDPKTLQSLVEGALTPPQQTAVSEHLEGCEGCQQRVERLAAADEAWAVAARHSGHAGTPPDPHLARVLEKCQDDSWPSPDVAGAELPAGFLQPPEKPGTLGRLGVYDILEVTGRGGMGIVLKAFDRSLHRIVAIKVMAPQLAASPSGRKRFVREAHAAAAVRDQHVVDIHAIGEEKGLPYLVMEFVSGISLQTKIETSAPLPAADVLRIGVQTAAGLAAAHAHGLVHRDVKPANVLLENGVERVKITDFGLARAADDSTLTQSGVVSGTPQYMAPEQARGEAVDHRADLFSLGSVLYALGTGCPPFRVSGNMATLKSVCDDTPRPIREINPDVPDWLTAVIEKLHAKDPAHRFQSAREVADLLAGYLAHVQGPERGRPPAFAPVRTPGRRRRVWLVAAAAVALLGAAAAVTVPRLLPPSGDGGAPGPGPSAAPAVQVRLRATLTGHAGTVNFLAFNRDGTVLASAGAHGDNSVRLWDPVAETHLATLDGHSDQVMGLAFRPDGKTLASVGWDGSLKLWRVESRTAIKSFDHSHRLWAVAFSPDGRLVVTGAPSAVKVWDVDTFEERVPLQTGGWGRSLAFTPNGKTLAVLIGWETDRNVQFWDFDGRQRRAAPPAHLDGANGAAITPDGTLLATGGLDRTVKLWDVAAGTEFATLPGHRWAIEGLAISADGSLLASGAGQWQRRDEPGEVKLWDAATRRELHTLREHQGCVFAVAFSPDGKTLATGSADRTIRLWNVARTPAE